MLDPAKIKKITRGIDSLTQRFDAVVKRKDDDFKESDHPRASDGKFGSGGGSSASKVNTTPRVIPTRVEKGPERHQAILKLFGKSSQVNSDRSKKINEEQKAAGLSEMGEDEQTALLCYLGNNYMQINGPMRDGFKKYENGKLLEYKPNPKSAKEKNLSAVVSALDDAIAKMPKNNDPVLRLSRLEDQDLERFLERYKEGEELTEERFMSATKGTGKNLTLFGGGEPNIKIRINGGGHSVPKAAEKYAGEEEVIYGRGSKFKVKSVKKNLGGAVTGKNVRSQPDKYEIELEYV